MEKRRFRLLPLQVAVTILLTVVRLVIANTAALLYTNLHLRSITYNTDPMSVLSRWDVNLETLLIRSGATVQSSVLVKFPAFSFLVVKPLVLITHWDIPTAQFVGSIFTTFLMLLAIPLLVDELYGEQHPEYAEWATWLMAFPIIGGFAIAMPYPEAFYIALWALSFYLFFRGRKADDPVYTILACIPTVLAVLCRPHAILVLGTTHGLATLWDAYRALRQGKQRRDSVITRYLVQLIVLVIIPALVFAWWMNYTSVATQTPLAPLTFQRDYGRVVYVWPWQTIADTFHTFAIANDDWGAWYQAGALIYVLLSLVVLGWLTLKKRCPWEILIMTALTPLIPLTGAQSGIPHFSLASWSPLVPMYFLNERRSKFVIVLGVTFMVLVTYSLIFPEPSFNP